MLKDFVEKRRLDTPGLMMMYPDTHQYYLSALKQNIFFDYLTSVQGETLSIPETLDVALYLLLYERCAPTTLQKRLASLSAAHDIKFAESFVNWDTEAWLTLRDTCQKRDYPKSIAC